MAISPPLSIAARALLAHQTALAVTSNNIANVNTPGYAREVAELLADPHYPLGGALVGSGVHVALVSQVIDPLLDRRLLRAETARREHGAARDQLAALSALASDLDAPSLASAVSGFFEAAEALARNPQGLSERHALLGRAGALAGELRRRYAAVADLQRDADTGYQAVAAKAQADLERIAALNQAIVAAEAGGQRANALRGERQQALAGLAARLGISTVEDATGALTVSTDNGVVLVNGAEVVHALVVRAGAPGLDGDALHEVGVADAAGGFIATPAAFARGELAGLASVRDADLTAAAAALDTLALALRDAVNGIQTDAAARDLDGGSTPGLPLFGGTGAADLRVLIDDPRRLAAALSAEPGDNQNALRLADLAGARLAALGGTTFTGFLAAEQGRLGEAAARAADDAAASDGFAQQLENQRASLSGVNLNEEMANLLKYQRAFEAATRVVSVADDMLAELMELI
jgi:flagellar hook-associated protein 1 FlgK